MISNQVINYLLDTKDTSLISFNNLTDAFFPDYKKEFIFILDHFHKYNNIPDKETFLEKFPDFDLVKVSETPQYLIEELYKEYNKNQLAYTFNNIRKYIINGNINKAIEEYQKSYENITTGISLHSVDILKDTQRYNDYIDRISNFDKYFIRTGFPELDSILGGWDAEEELAVIMGRSNFGKTWILLKCVLAAAEQGLTVGLYSGEMSEKKVGYRIDTLLQHLPNGSLIHGNEQIRDDYKTYIENLPNRLKGSIKVLTPKMINGRAGVNALRAFIEKDNLNILFIDQHSLLEDDRHAKNPIEKASNISKDLKNLQVMKRIPIIAVSQQNRNALEDDKIDISNISASDRIGQDATTIIGISRDKKDPTLMTLQVVKARDSVVGGRLTYKTDLNKGAFKYIATGNDPTQDKQYKDRYEDNEDEEVF